MNRRAKVAAANAPHQCPPGDGERLASLTASLPDPETLDQLSGVFRLLGDPGRVALLVTLLEAGEICVHDLAAVVGQSESGVSHSLRLLRAHRIVAVRRSGRHAFYRLADGHVRMLLDIALTHIDHASALHVTEGPASTHSKDPL